MVVSNSGQNCVIHEQDTDLIYSQEWGMGIICACIPSMRCFWRVCRSSHIGQRVFFSGSSKRSLEEMRCRGVDLEQPQLPYANQFMESLHSLEPERPTPAVCR
jgi:hypothetical protein